MASKRKQNIAFEQKLLNKPQTLQKVLSCIRSYGQPMPLAKLAPVFAKKYGRNSPTIQQVFGCSALELLEGPEMTPFVRVTYNTTQRQYFVAPIKNVKEKISKAQTKKQPAQAPKIKERTVNAFVEAQPKPALSLEKTLINVIDLVLQSPTKCVQLSEVPQLFKEKTGVDLNFKEKFGTSALQVMERPPLSDHLLVVTATSTQHWVTLVRNKMLTALVDLLREMGTDWVRLSALLNKYKHKTGIGLNFPKMFGQSTLDVITTHFSDQIFVEEQPKYTHWLALKPEGEETSDSETESESDQSESDELGPQLWDFDIRQPGEVIECIPRHDVATYLSLLQDESDSEGSDLEDISPEETLIAIMSLVLESPNKCVLLSDVPRLFEQKTGVVLNFKETFGSKALKAFQRPPLSDHLSVFPGTSSQHWVTLNDIEVDILSQSEYYTETDDTLMIHYTATDDDDEDEDLDGVIDVTSRFMLDAFAQRPPPRKALKALCARTTKLVSRMSLSE